jgi:hypothetical protein
MAERGRMVVEKGFGPEGVAEAFLAILERKGIG